MFRVVSWNVNSINSRIERVVKFLETEGPDVLCLQELKGEEHKFPLDRIQSIGYRAAIYGQKTYNGVAILSKKPIKNVNKGFQDREDDPAARFISAQVGGVTIMCAYVPNGQAVGTDKYEYKLKWLKRLRKYLDNEHEEKDKLILVGDFNIAPEDRDVYDPKVWKDKILFSDPEKKALQTVLEFGFEDTFRMHHEDGGLYSWWDYRQLAFPKNRGLRIDFVLATASVAKKCSGAKIFRDERKANKLSKPSDHAPVMAEFKL